MKRIGKCFVTLSMAALIAVPFSACNKAIDLESPTGFVLSDNYTLSWMPVENARNYLVEIKNVETGETVESTSRREYVILEYLAVGDYDIRVRAEGDNTRYKSSVWSAVLAFNRADDLGCVYKLINNGLEYEVKSVVSTLSSLAMPESYRDKPITSIGATAFSKAKSLESVVVGKNVKSIGTSAFYNCVALKNVTMPDTLTEIGDSAFQNCRSIESFRVPAGVTYLNYGVFGYCRSLKEVDFNNVREIGESAFLGCSGFESITIPDTVTHIGRGAFREASYDGVGLKEVNIGSGVTSIGAYAFLQCDFLEKVNFNEENNVIEIGPSAFAYDVALQSIELPEGLEQMGQQVFYGCTSLTNVSIPDSLSILGYSCFANTPLYDEAEEAGEHLLYVDGWMTQRVVQDDEFTIKNLYAENPQNKPDTEVIKEGTVGIADLTFYSYPGIQDVKLSATVKYVGASSFKNCENLFRFDASESSLEIVDLSAFAYSKMLQYVYFNHVNPRLKQIGDKAFLDCESLEYNSAIGGQFIPLSVENIGSLAFTGTGLYDNADEYGVIYADNWVIGCTGSDEDDLGGWMTKPGDKNKGAETIVLREDQRGIRIAEYAFYNCTKLKNIEGAYNATIIGRGAFYECNNLMGITLNSNLTKIDDYTFYECNNLTLNRFPTALRSIGKSAFYNCYQMQEVELSSRIESLGEFAFYGCGNLTTLEIGSGLTEIPSYAFYKCRSLTSVTIPSNIKSIGKSAFSRCSGLKEVIFEEGVEEIGPYAFSRNFALEEINLPDSVKSVGNAAFFLCESVRSIDLNQVETIGDFAFSMNRKVANIVIPESVKSIGMGAFYGLGSAGWMSDFETVFVGSVRSVIIAGPDRIDAHAFYACTEATFYVEAENKSDEWGTAWNSLRRPVVWGVKLSEDKSYVVSLTVKKDTFEYYSGLNSPTAPYRAGYTFLGWSNTPGSTQIAYTLQNVIAAPVGTTLYAVYMQE